MISSINSNWERFLPNQIFLRENYQGDTPYEEKFHALFMSILNLSEPHEKFILQESNLFTITQMASGPLILQFLQFLIQATGTKKILEIGTFIGLSAMYFAEALPADGLVVTIEKFADFADIARINFQKNQFEDKIKLIVGDAFKVLKEQDLGNSFDFIFIDGNKEHYGDYLDFAIALLSENGTIVIDNVTFQGDILNSPPKTPKGLGVMNCLEKIKNLSGWDISLIPFNDGLLLLRRSPTSH